MARGNRCLVETYFCVSTHHIDGRKIVHLYFIRHGQSYVNLKDWKNGNIDEGLTELGQSQAAALAAWTPDGLPHIDALYASTMRRASETAQALADACNCSIRYDDRLREIGNNRSDHSPWPNDALPKEYADYWASERPFATTTPAMEGGESFMHFRTRVGNFVEEIVQRYRGDGDLIAEGDNDRKQVIVAVCHGGVIESAFDHIFNVGPWRRCEVWDHNTGVSHFEYMDHPERETWRLHYHNRINHLRAFEG